MRRGRQSRWKNFTDREIERLARLVRKFAGIHGQKTPNLLDASEKLARIFPKLRVRIVENSDLVGAEARAQPSFWIIKIKRGVYDGLLRGDAGARWTFAHELGHTILQHPGRPFRKREVKDDSLVERQAHIFAAQLLAPSDLASLAKSPDEIASMFRLSSEAARRRYDEIGSDNRKRQFGLKRITLATTNETLLLEDISAQICSAILTTIAETRPSAELLIEPWKNNLFSTSIVTAKGSQLLLDSYESIYRSSTQDQYAIAASVAAAILNIRPIREIGLSNQSPREVSTLNQICALRAAASILKIDLSCVNIEENIRSTFMEFDGGYLTPLIDSADALILNSSTVLNFSDLPLYYDYNGSIDISWSEIDAFKAIMAILQLVKDCRQ